MSELTIEVNPKPILEPLEKDPLKNCEAVSKILSPDYWLLRVPLSEKNAVVAFPKGGQLGIGFQHEPVERDRNVPFRCSPEAIVRGIAANKGDDSIPDDKILEAVKVLRAKCYALRGEDPNEEPLEKKKERFEQQLGDKIGAALVISLLTALAKGKVQVEKVSLGLDAAKPEQATPGPRVHEPLATDPHPDDGFAA